MKKTLLFAFAILISASAMAQPDLQFPFTAGRKAMTQFFKDSLTVSQDIIQKRATGTVIVKFTANKKGAISKIVVYYADDAVLTTPIIDAIKKSDHKWTIPEYEKAHDFIIAFSVNINPPADGATLGQAMYDSYRTRSPILTSDQVPLDESTLLPAVTVSYDVAQ